MAATGNYWNFKELAAPRTVEAHAVNGEPCQERSGRGVFAVKRACWLTR